MSNKLVLIDGNSIIYRAFFALPLLNNDKGVYTNAVYGFTTMLLKILEEEKPTHMLVAYDAGKTTFRHDTYKEYKGGRQKTPGELSEQFPLTKELLDAFRIPHYELDRKSTRLNSSHVAISYAVFCLKKKKTKYSE